MCGSLCSPPTAPPRPQSYARRAPADNKAIMEDLEVQLPSQIGHATFPHNATVVHSTPTAGTANSSAQPGAASAAGTSNNAGKSAAKSDADGPVWKDCAATVKSLVRVLASPSLATSSSSSHLFLLAPKLPPTHRSLFLHLYASSLRLTSFSCLSVSLT
ncbi:hypothetical protein PGT21_016287 [Puccinia graminis f. sp. tritici]|uniref:Uncharacterized protein n=1 Tax=Puccinia graminis f. sp. tritici TaxID=56615 RepID=A0A5B0N0S4_PUCGR|nr:hypothetical protein PGT21_016287 [Puccinia graminis f. sp. tritici]